MGRSKHSGDNHFDALNGRHKGIKASVEGFRAAEKAKKRAKKDTKNAPGFYGPQNKKKGK